MCRVGGDAVDVEATGMLEVEAVDHDTAVEGSEFVEAVEGAGEGESMSDFLRKKPRRDFCFPENSS